MPTVSFSLENRLYGKVQAIASKRTKESGQEVTPQAVIREWVKEKLDDLEELESLEEIIDGK